LGQGSQYDLQLSYWLCYVGKKGVIKLVNMKGYLSRLIQEKKISLEGLQLPDIELDPGTIRVLMISEGPPQDPGDHFYSTSPAAVDRRSALALFSGAGIAVADLKALLAKGIYITTAVKSPKDQYRVDPERIKAHLPILEAELQLFPNLQVVMLMGDVAKKAFNIIAKRATKKNAVPSGSTYKIRETPLYYNHIRLFPSYIMTGGNLLIEKSKVEMITEDIQTMIKLIDGKMQ